MRARNLKPKFFQNELLAPADPLYSLIFAGLWCLADRNGRLEDRPFQIHLSVNPARVYDGTERAIAWLCEHEFIRRYAVGGKRYIQIVAFDKHQIPHHREPSVYPAEQLQSLGLESNIIDEKPRACLGPDVGSELMKVGVINNLPPLNPESCFLNPESPILNPSMGSAQGQPRARPKRRGTKANRMPSEYTPGADIRAWAAENTPSVDFDYELGKCRDHTFRTARADWDAVLRNWLRTAHESSNSKPTAYKSMAKQAKTSALTTDELDNREIDKAIAVGLSDDEIFRHLQFIPIERIRQRRHDRDDTARKANGQY
jgi:hypothetical protein